MIRFEFLLLSYVAILVEPETGCEFLEVFSMTGVVYGGFSLRCVLTGAVVMFV